MAHSNGRTKAIRYIATQRTNRQETRRETASRRYGTSPNPEREPTERRPSHGGCAAVSASGRENKNAGKPPALWEKPYSSLGHCRLQPFGSPLSPRLRIADFLSD